MSSEGHAERTPRETVEDPNGNEKTMIGRPAGMKDFDIPTGDTDLDWRCPQCGEIGSFSRLRKSSPLCVNRDCRVDRFSPWVWEGIE